VKNPENPLRLEQSPRQRSDARAVFEIRHSFQHRIRVLTALFQEITDGNHHDPVSLLARSAFYIYTLQRIDSFLFRFALTAVID